MPTPAGVPVAMMSPGSSVNAVESVSICAAQSKIISLVDASWSSSSFTQVRMRRSCGSAISSAVTTQGPIGPWVSKLLPMRHRRRLELPVAHGDVVDDRVAGDHLVGAGRRGT